jgi:hypothetical protein
MDWRPISTAPKRTYVLIWERGAKKPTIASNWHGDDGDYWQSGDDAEGYSDQLYPACWMPLPAKPDLRQFRDAPRPPPVDNRKEWEKFVPSPFAHRWPQDD